MDCQTLLAWVHSFNTERSDGLRDYQHAGLACRLNTAQQAELEGSKNLLWMPSVMQEIFGHYFGSKGMGYV